MEMRLGTRLRTLIGGKMTFRAVRDKYTFFSKSQAIHFFFLLQCSWGLCDGRLKMRQGLVGWEECEMRTQAANTRVGGKMTFRAVRSCGGQTHGQPVIDGTTYKLNSTLRYNTHSCLAKQQIIAVQSVSLHCCLTPDWLDTTFSTRVRNSATL